MYIANIGYILDNPPTGVAGAYGGGGDNDLSSSWTLSGSDGSWTNITCADDDNLITKAECPSSGIGHYLEYTLGGAYTLTIQGEFGTSGGFNLATSAKFPTKDKGVKAVVTPDDVVALVTGRAEIEGGDVFGEAIDQLTALIARGPCRGVRVDESSAALLDDVGGLFFEGRLTGSTATDKAIVHANAAGEFTIVLREGDSVEVAPGDTRTLFDFSWESSSTALETGRLGFNNSGEIAVRGTFSDFSQAIITVPEPGASQGLAAGLMVLWKLSSRRAMRQKKSELGEQRTRRVEVG